VLPYFRAPDKVLPYFRIPDKVRIFTSVMPISSPNLMFDHLLESSRRDDSNKWSNMGFDEEIKLSSVGRSLFYVFIWRSDYASYKDL